MACYMVLWFKSSDVRLVFGQNLKKNKKKQPFFQTFVMAGSCLCSSWPVGGHGKSPHSSSWRDDPGQETVLAAHARCLLLTLPPQVTSQSDHKDQSLYLPEHIDAWHSFKSTAENNPSPSHILRSLLGSFLPLDFTNTFSTSRHSM